jgi:hypothetical protein
MGKICVVPLECADLEDDFHISINNRHSLIFQEKFLSLSSTLFQLDLRIVPHISGVAHATLRHCTDTFDNDTEHILVLHTSRNLQRLLFLHTSNFKELIYTLKIEQ